MSKPVNVTFLKFMSAWGTCFVLGCAIAILFALPALITWAIVTMAMTYSLATAAIVLFLIAVASLLPAAASFDQ